MGLLREDGSDRLRASLRGVLPAIVTLAVLLIGRAALTTTFSVNGATLSTSERLIVRGLLFVVYGVMIGLGLWVASRLDRRPYTQFGLGFDRALGRDFAAGVIISVTGIGLSLWWGVFRGLRAIDLSVALTGTGGSLFQGFAIAVFVAYLFVGNLYEELIYRGVMLQNFAEGLDDRGWSPGWSVAVATAASLVLFGAYHFPLRGTVIVVVDAAMIGSTFAVAYLLTGELGLPIGVHFGRTTFELATGVEILGVELPAILAITQNTLAANLEVRLLELSALTVLILSWVAVSRGEIRVTRTITD